MLVPKINVSTHTPDIALILARKVSNQDQSTILRNNQNRKGQYLLMQVGKIFNPLQPRHDVKHTNLKKNKLKFLKKNMMKKV